MLQCRMLLNWKKKGLLNRRDDLSRKCPSFWVSGMRSVLMTKKAIPSVVTRIVQILNRSYQMGNTWQTPRICFRRQMSQMVAMKLLPKSKMDCKSAHCHYEVLLRAVRKDCSFWLVVSNLVNSLDQNFILLCKLLHCPRADLNFINVFIVQF